MPDALEMQRNPVARFPERLDHGLLLIEPPG